MIRNFIFILLFLLQALLQQRPSPPVITGERSYSLVNRWNLRWSYGRLTQCFRYAGYYPIHLLALNTSALIVPISSTEITITSWDSGVWKLEPIKAIVPSNVNGQPIELLFPCEEITVAYVTTGSKIMNDVKPIMGSQVTPMNNGLVIQLPPSHYSALCYWLYYSGNGRQKKPLFWRRCICDAVRWILKSTARLQQQSWSTAGTETNSSPISFLLSVTCSGWSANRCWQRTTDGVSIDCTPWIITWTVIEISCNGFPVNRCCEVCKIQIAGRRMFGCVTDIKQWVQQVDEQLRWSQNGSNISTFAYPQIPLVIAVIAIAGDCIHT